MHTDDKVRYVIHFDLFFFRLSASTNLVGKFTQSVRRIVQDVKDEGTASEYICIQVFPYFWNKLANDFFLEFSALEACCGAFRKARSKKLRECISIYTVYRVYSNMCVYTCDASPRGGALESSALYMCVFSSSLFFYSNPSGGQTKEEVIETNERLRAVRIRLDSSYETAKRALVELMRKYTDSKQVRNVFERYTLLKLMIKVCSCFRILMCFYLNNSFFVSFG